MDSIIGDKFSEWTKNQLERLGFVPDVTKYRRRLWCHKKQTMSVVWKRKIFTLKRFKWPWLRRKGQYVFRSIDSRKIVEKAVKWIEEETSNDFVKYNQQYILKMRQLVKELLH